MEKPTEDAINEQLNLAQERVDEGGSAFPGMSYEEGVIAGIRWVRGEDDARPMDE